MTALGWIAVVLGGWIVVATVLALAYGQVAKMGNRKAAECRKRAGLEP